MFIIHHSPSHFYLILRTSIILITSIFFYLGRFPALSFFSPHTKLLPYSKNPTLLQISHLSLFQNLPTPTPKLSDLSAFSTSTFLHPSYLPFGIHSTFLLPSDPSAGRYLAKNHLTNRVLTRAKQPYRKKFSRLASAAESSLLSTLQAIP